MLQSCERKAGSPVCLSWSDAHFRLQPAHNRKTDTNLRQVSALRAGKTHLFALCNSLGQRRTNTPVFILKTTPTSLRRSGEQRGGFDCCPKRATASQARGVGRTRLRPTPSYPPLTKSIDTHWWLDSPGALYSLLAPISMFNSRLPFPPSALFFARPGSTVRHFLLSPKDRNPVRPTGAQC